MARDVSYKFGIVAIIAIVLCILCDNVKGQTLTTCAKSDFMKNVNATKLAGAWFEVARKPSIANMACLEVDFKLLSENKILNMAITYVDSQVSPWANSTASTNITLTSADTNGYVVSLSLGSAGQIKNTLKLLDTDYTNYAIICGYSNATDESTSFSAILTRQRMPSSATISSYEQNASKDYVNFTNMTMVNQTEKCYRSSATTPIPVSITLFVFVYGLIKYVH